jgi:hypothetical protein
VSGRRGRRAVFADEDQAAGSVIAPRLGPVVFTVRFRDGERTIDWSALPCPKLARALTEMGGEDGTIRHWPAFLTAAGTARDFVHMIAAAWADTDAVTLGDLTAGHVDAFEDELIARYPAGIRTPYLMMGYLVRILRRVHDSAPGQLDPGLVARAAFTSRRSGKPPSTPLDAYPLPVFEAITAAALTDVQAIARRIISGEKLAARGRDPEVAGWRDPANIAWHVSRYGPVTSAHPKTPLGGWSSVVPGGVRAVNRMLYLMLEDLVPFVVAVTCLTGMEPECVKALRADCLASPARGYVSIRYLKRRAKGHEDKSMRVADGGSPRHPGGLIRLALRLTQRGRDQVGGTALWIDANEGTVRESFAGSRLIWRHFGPWMRRHGLDQLADRDGTPVRLHLDRLRKSWKSGQYLRARGVVADFAQGHTAEVAAGHYADIGAHRDVHEQAVEDGLRQAMAVALPTPVVLGDDGARLDDGDQDLPPGQVRAALSGSSDVFLASCRDFYDTPFAARGKPCPVPMWGCLECPNAVFTTRHLPQVLAFLSFTESQRDEYTAAEWELRYGTAHGRIVTGIRDRFAPAQITTAQAIAEGGGARLLLPPQFAGGPR